MDNKTSIYIVCTQTGTILSRILKIITKAEYNHVSISLDSTLNHMYSFGRKNAYNPIIGGLVQENPNWGTFKRFSNTKAKIIGIEIDTQDYENIKHYIEEMYSHKEDYHYNLYGLAYGYFNIPYKKDNYYYCSEFVREILLKGRVITEIEFNTVVKPIDFLSLKNYHEVYEGYLKEYMNNVL